ncbi:MAG: hypothetical protein AB7F99_17275 [Vicinamibacterales bacterium]
MSLKAFHLVFIAMSVILSVFMAAWASGQYRADAGIGYLAAAALSVLAGVGLAVYGTKFQRKMRRMERW